MDLDELRAFLTVVETGSFLSASQALKIPRGTLRRRVDALEVRIGSPLLERSPQGVQATEAGNILAHKGRKIVQDVHAVIASLQDLSSQARGVVHALFPVGFPPHLLPALLEMVATACPGISLDVRFAENPVANIRATTDLVVFVDTTPPPSPWVTRELFRARTSLLASRDYVETRGAPQTLHDLHAHAFYCWQPGGAQPVSLPLRAGGNVTVHAKATLADYHLLRCIAAAGLGLVYAADPNLRGQDDLVPVLPEVVGGEHIIYLALRAEAENTAKNRAVLEACTNLVHSYFS